MSGISLHFLPLIFRLIFPADFSRAKFALSFTGNATIVRALKFAE